MTAHASSRATRKPAKRASTATQSSWSWYLGYFYSSSSTHPFLDRTRQPSSSLCPTSPRRQPTLCLATSTESSTVPRPAVGMLQLSLLFIYPFCYSPETNDKLLILPSTKATWPEIAPLPPSSFHSRPLPVRTHLRLPQIPVHRKICYKESSSCYKTV